MGHRHSKPISTIREGKFILTHSFRSFFYRDEVFFDTTQVLFGLYFRQSEIQVDNRDFNIWHNYFEELTDVLARVSPGEGIPLTCGHTQKVDSVISYVIRCLAVLSTSLDAKLKTLKSLLFQPSKYEDPNGLFAKGDTVLHILLRAECFKKAHFRLFEALLKFQAWDVRAVHRKSERLVDLAAQVQADSPSSSPFLALLRYDSAAVNVANKKGMTPLHYAAKVGNYSVFSALTDQYRKEGVRTFIDLGRQDKQGKTILDYAQKNKNVAFLMAVNSLEELLSPPKAQVFSWGKVDEVRPMETLNPAFQAVEQGRARGSMASIVSTTSNASVSRPAAQVFSWGKVDEVRPMETLNPAFQAVDHGRPRGSTTSTASTTSNTSLSRPMAQVLSWGKVDEVRPMETLNPAFQVAEHSRLRDSIVSTVSTASNASSSSWASPQANKTPESEPKAKEKSNLHVVVNPFRQKEINTHPVEGSLPKARFLTPDFDRASTPPKPEPESESKRSETEVLNPLLQL